MARMRRKFADRPTAKKSKPRRTTTKKRDRPTVTKTKKVGAPDTKGGDRHPGSSQSISKPTISSGVDPGLARAVADRTADRATGKFFGMPASTPIGYGTGKVDPALAAAAGIGPAAGGFPGTTAGAGVGVGTGISGVGAWHPGVGRDKRGYLPDHPLYGKDDTIVDTTTDDGTPPDKDGTPPDKEEEKKFFIEGVGMVNKRLNDYYKGLLKRMDNEKAIERVKLKKMEDEWADKNLDTLWERFSEKGPLGLPLGPLGIIKGALTKQPYEHDFLGSAGAANILNKLEKIKGKTDKETAQLKQNYVNQIIEANPEGASKMFGIDLQYGNITPESFEKTLVSSNQGNKNFDKNYYKTVGAYWDVNTPQTQGDQESMATAFQQGNLKMTKANTLAIQNAIDIKSRMEDAANVGLDRIGGGQPATDPADTTDPNKPYGNLTFDVYGRPITNYDYTGGPEQLYLGGGWKKDGVYAGYPWGPHTFKEGGIANFKPYGY